MSLVTWTSPSKWLPWNYVSPDRPTYHHFDSPMVKPKLWRTPLSPRSDDSPSALREIISNVPNSASSTMSPSTSWDKISRIMMMKRPKSRGRCSPSMRTYPDYDCLRPTLTPGAPMTGTPLSDITTPSTPKDVLATHYKSWVCADAKLLVNGFGRLCARTEAIDDESAAVQSFRVLAANYVFDNMVSFDSYPQRSSDNTVLTTSSNGFSIGVHEWSVQIQRCDEYRQEIGVVENPNYRSDVVMSPGVAAMPGLGAKIVYGNEKRSGPCYYASYNSDGSVRVKKTISQKSWAVGDIVRTVLNLKKGNIQFFINGRKARKKLSVPKNRKYYPMLLFTGNCKYKVVSFQ